MEEENTATGDGNHSQAKKTKLSEEHNKPESLSTMAAAAVADVAKQADTQPPLPSSSGTVSTGQDDGDTKMSEADDKDEGSNEKPHPQPVNSPETSKMSVEDDTTVSSSPKPSEQTESVAADASKDSSVKVETSSVEGANASTSAVSAPAAGTNEGDGAAAAAAAPEDPPAAAAATAGGRRNRPNRPRYRFRGRNYRLRSNSSGSDRAAQDDANDDPDVEAIIRRLVDEINQEDANASHDDDDAGNNDDDDDDNNADGNSDTSSADSDDSDSSPAVSVDDDDDDDSDDSDNEGAAENNANEQIDVENLPFMQTGSVKNSWNYFRDIQLRSAGLSFRGGKTNLGGPGFSPIGFQSRAYGSKHLVERLDLSHRLCEHDGCVNSLNFNSAGTLLASGSDDLKINLWHWQTNKLMQSISSGHRANVFQTKFVDATGYRGEIEIISTGRDGQVRQTRVGPAGEVTRTVLFKQSQAIHKIAIPARNQFEFLTACEDGVIKSYDLRDNVTKRVTNAKKRLYSISTHPLDNEFCVSGNDESVRVYDRRNPSKPMKFHYAAHMKTKKDHYTVTCAVYNSTGTEILASCSDEDVFLFDNVNHEDGKFLHRYSGHCNMKTIKGVNFFGPNSEFVVSGSDCGNIFFWDKETEVIVNWLHGDDSGVVNCLEPHPEFPIMATSGLDDDAKIWIPKGADDQHESPVFSRESLEKCVRRNLRNRQANRCASYSEDRILDFLMFSRQGIGGRLRRPFSSDSEDQADGDGNGGGGAGGGTRRSGGGGAGGGGGGRRGRGSGGGRGGRGGGGGGRDGEDDDRMILQCSQS